MSIRVCAYLVVCAYISACVHAHPCSWLRQQCMCVCRPCTTVSVLCLCYLNVYILSWRNVARMRSKICCTATMWQNYYEWLLGACCYWFERESRLDGAATTLLEWGKWRYQTQSSESQYFSLNIGHRLCALLSAAISYDCYLICYIIVILVFCNLFAFLIVIHAILTRDLTVSNILISWR